MVVTGRQKSIAFFIALGAGLITIILLLYVGWVLLHWRNPILLFLGIVLLAVIIAGVVLNTIFLVREIRRNEQHDAFINAVTHELKTPVASIRLYLETLLTRSVDDKKREEFYRIMLEDSDRLLHTIEQVLRTGRLGAAHPVMSVAAIELNPLLRSCLERARTLHGLPQDALLFEPGGDYVINGDADEVQSALSNLIDNAVKYSRPHVKVAVQTASPDGKTVAIRVNDKGVGIARDELKRVFKRFYRVPGPLTARQKGTGLGLFIVRSVAKRHGGKVWAESAGIGQGSTFIFQLPVSNSK
jgi:two-component system sensor histidine kinase SenX3